MFVSEITSRIVDLDKFLGVFTKLGFRLLKNVNLKDYFFLLILSLDKESESADDGKQEKINKL